MERHTWSADFQVGSLVLRRSRLAFSSSSSLFLEWRLRRTIAEPT
jgi:hypothetical protein